MKRLIVCKRLTTSLSVQPIFVISPRRRIINVFIRTFEFCGIPIVTAKPADSKTNVHPNLVYFKLSLLKILLLLKNTFGCTLV